MTGEVQFQRFEYTPDRQGYATHSDEEFKETSLFDLVDT